MTIWIIFLIIASALVFAASRLTVYADRLAEQFGLTRSWMGLLVVGLVTSLPEIATTLSAITKVGRPDLALGNVFGSVIFNLAIIGICDVVFRRGGILRLMGTQHKLSAQIDVAMLVLVMAGLLLPLPALRLGPLHCALGSVAVLVAGIAGFWMTYQAEHSDTHEEDAEQSDAEGVDRKVVLQFLGSAAAVVICGNALAVTGDKLAVATGMSITFVGTLFLAVATSLPELVVSVTAIRMGSYDLMLGNLLGSNIWNVMIMGLADLAYVREGLHVPSNLGWGQIFSGSVGLAATVIVLRVLLRPKDGRKPVRVGSESFVLLGLYLLCLAGLFFGKDFL